MAKGYDPQCAELARYFNPNGSDGEIASLAQDIQDAVEDWFFVEKGDESYLTAGERVTKIRSQDKTNG